jgi:hypothetical protein
VAGDELSYSTLYPFDFIMPPLNDWKGNDSPPSLGTFFDRDWWLELCVEWKMRGRSFDMSGLQAGRQPQMMPTLVSMDMIA